MNPNMPIHAEGIYVGVTPISPNRGANAGAGGERCNSMRQHRQPPLPPPHNVDWETRHEMLQQELDNARIRSTQVKTICLFSYT